MSIDNKFRSIKIYITLISTRGYNQYNLSILTLSSQSVLQNEVTLLNMYLKG